jgi:hypothetical protein
MKWNHRDSTGSLTRQNAPEVATCLRRLLRGKTFTLTNVYNLNAPFPRVTTEAGCQFPEQGRWIDGNSDVIRVLERDDHVILCFLAWGWSHVFVILDEVRADDGDPTYRRPYVEFRDGKSVIFRQAAPAGNVNEVHFTVEGPIRRDPDETLEEIRRKPENPFTAVDDCVILETVRVALGEPLYGFRNSEGLYLIEHQKGFDWGPPGDNFRDCVGFPSQDYAYRVRRDNLNLLVARTPNVHVIRLEDR